jgi:hypothetical protein
MVLFFAYKIISRVLTSFNGSFFIILDSHRTLYAEPFHVNFALFPESEAAIDLECL